MSDSAEKVPLVCSTDALCCILHNQTGIPTIIGKNVTAGHGAILHGCDVGDNCLIAMGAILLNSTVIGEGSVVAAGSLVTERTAIPPDSMVMGSPGKIVRSVKPEETEYIRSNAKHYYEFAKEQLLPIEEAIKLK